MNGRQMLLETTVVGKRCVASASPRAIADELTVLQQCFIEAHEEQVHQLLKLLAAAGVQLPSKMDTLPKATGENRGPVEECTLLQGSSALSWDDRVVLQADIEDAKCRDLAGPDLLASGGPASGDGQSYGGADDHAMGSLRFQFGHDNGAPKPAIRTLAFSSEVETESAVSMLTEVERMAVESEEIAAENRKLRLEKTGVLQSSARRTVCADIQELIPTGANGGSSTRASDGALMQRITDRIYECTEHTFFDLLCGLAIALNAFFMAYETDWALTAQVGSPIPRWMKMIGKAFTSFFLFELVLRMCGGLRRFFCSCNIWNYFDLCIVSLAILEEVLSDVANLSNVRMIRLLRLTRTMKVFRTLRIVRLVGALRTLINSLIGTFKLVIWAFFLIVCLIFVFGVIFGQVVSQARWSEPYIMEDEAMQFFWGDLSSCMYTLFLSVSSGVSWYEAAQPLRELGTPVFLGFITYVALAQWVILNVITGFFCESAAEAARKDVALAVQSHRSDRDKFLQMCKHIFRTIDTDNSGELDINEMRHLLDTEPAQALFATLEIAADDAKELFELLDEDGTEFVELEEFMLGCLRLRGGAKALDVAKMQYQIKLLARKIDAVLAAVPRHIR
eukprot:TRINITY_DN11978_c0_g3_i1.p1 TRINITY_DN11978_c0_g3~~TRINITY_DN11978_c0_g3_i1.p1  ORF type:complete len:658 (+),score=69.04 TRINITY_DN11978_c0_g3_i1:117-1976(+)